MTTVQDDAQRARSGTVCAIPRARARDARSRTLPAQFFTPQITYLQKPPLLLYLEDKNADPRKDPWDEQTQEFTGSGG